VAHNPGNICSKWRMKPALSGLMTQMWKPTALMVVSQKMKTCRYEEPELLGGESLRRLLPAAKRIKRVQAQPEDAHQAGK
jgi:hypothetical protein